MPPEIKESLVLNLAGSLPSLAESSDKLKKSRSLTNVKDTTAQASQSSSQPNPPSRGLRRKNLSKPRITKKASHGKKPKAHSRVVSDNRELSSGQSNSSSKLYLKLSTKTPRVSNKSPRCIEGNNSDDDTSTSNEKNEAPNRINDIANGVIESSKKTQKNENHNDMMLPDRLSTLARLAAGLSLAGLEFGSEESGSEGYSIPEEILQDDGLTLPEHNQWTIQPGEAVNLTAKLGKGATAEVWSGIIANKVVAVKRIELKKFSEGLKYAQMSVNREYDIVQSLNHTNIVKYYGMFSNKHTHQVHLVMELIDGVPVTDLVLFCVALTEDLASYILKYVSMALSVVHNEMVIHRDLKPDNVLIDINATVKLIDFGTATRCESNTITKRRSTVGTPWYCAPEVINTQPYDFTCDIWSLGCMAIELVSGKPPFDDLNDISCLYKMAEGNPPPFPENISDNCRDFLEKCLVKESTKRTPVKELLNHEFLTFDHDEEERRRRSLIEIINKMRNVKSEHILKKRTKLTKLERIVL